MLDKLFETFGGVGNMAKNILKDKLGDITGGLFG